MRQNWEKYIDSNGNFEFPKYLYRTISDMMKVNLDLGTLVCTDPAKLRAYKERVKATYKEKWLDIASILEYLEIIQPCICSNDEYCRICGGSRYLLSETMTASEIQDISLVLSNSVKADKRKEVAEKLTINTQIPLITNPLHRTEND